MPDWDAITRGWVDEGLLEEAQREPILRRLRALPADTGRLPVGPVVTLLVAGASWLLTGAAVTLLFLVGIEDEEVVGGVLSASGVMSLVAGGGLRAAPKLVPLARGFLAASPPLVTLGIVSMFGSAPPAAFAVVPGAIGAAIALLDGGRSVAATASVSCVFAATVALANLPDESWWATLLLVPSIALVAGIAIGSRFFAARAQVLEVLVPAGVLFLVIDVAFTHVHFPALWRPVFPRTHPWSVEKGLEGLLIGVLLVATGAFARSGWTLVPALALVAAATIYLAGVFGSWIGGTIALAVLGGTFLAAASVLWVLRTGERGA